MCDVIEAYTEEWVRARKPHRCCECSRAMDIGERHQVITGFVDREPLRFRTCNSCVVFRRWLTKLIQDGDALGDDDCGVPLGYLAECAEVAYEHYVSGSPSPRQEREIDEARMRAARTRGGVLMGGRA